MYSHYSSAPTDKIDLSYPQHNLLLLKISRSLETSSDIYNCARCCWKLNIQKAREADYILALQHGQIIGVYTPDRWFSADNKRKDYFPFPWQYEYIEKGKTGRFGFEGQEANSAIQNIYLGKEVIALPEGKSVKAQNPVGYAFKVTLTNTRECVRSHR